MKNIDELISLALSEDIGSGDITTLATIPPDSKSKAEILVKQNGVIAGLDVASSIINKFDSSLQYKKIKEDGDKVSKGEIVGTLEGSTRSILTIERTLLNFMQRMSGIATTVNLFTEKISHTKAKILDTRKTLPGFRMLDKYSVEKGGGVNHRTGLFDMFLIKDNHIAAAGSVSDAVKKCIEYRKEKKSGYKIEVEVKNLDELNEALKFEVDVIMLDNFSVTDMKKAVKIINSKCKVEASGMVNIDTVKEIAETGVDYISVGAITHSVKALDISLEITSSY
ncbi:MAG: carboxylating nicotinate-nucleotide diphosphorylase [Ignavibacteriales bacterium]|nr:MAG: carboxylating nicotinate-nucleotide diphosphorylase [Ignavibacteriales bacterium]